MAFYCDQQPHTRRIGCLNLAKAQLEESIPSTLREASAGPDKDKADKIRESNAMLAEAVVAPHFDEKPNIKVSIDIALKLPAQIKHYLPQEQKNSMKVRPPKC